MVATVTDLQEGAVPEPSAELHDDVCSRSQLVNVTHNVVASHVGSRLTVLSQTQTIAIDAAAAAADHDDEY